MKQLLKVEFKGIFDSKKTMFLTESELNDFKKSHEFEANHYEVALVNVADLTKYRNVYFRIESGYRWGSGFSEEESVRFHNEIEKLFSEYGWTINKKDMSGACDDVVKGKSRLYCHPMELSGVIRLDLVEEIEEIISKAKTFTLRCIDYFEELADITEEEYLDILKSKRELIENDLLSILTTKRSNLYITSISQLIGNIRKKYFIYRVGNTGLSYSSLDKDYQYYLEVLDDLIKDNKIITANTKNGLGYRTNKDKK